MDRPDEKHSLAGDKRTREIKGTVNNVLVKAFVNLVKDMNAAGTLEASTTLLAADDDAVFPAMEISLKFFPRLQEAGASSTAATAATAATTLH